MELTRPSPSLGPFVERLAQRSVLHDDERQALLSLPCTSKDVAAGQDVVRMGEKAGYISIIGAGVVGRFKTTVDGTRQITAIHFPGDAANLVSIVVPDQCVALTALSDVVVWEVQQSSLRSVISQYPAIAEAFWRDTSVDAAIKAEWLVNVGSRDAKARIAHLFCEMAVRRRALGQVYAYEYSFPVNQAELAEVTGLSTVHVNRTLQALRPYIVVRSGEVVVLDWMQLVKLGEFDPGYLQIAVRPEDRVRLTR